jgi:hypothetical protein
MQVANTNVSSRIRNETNSTAAWGRLMLLGRERRCPGRLLALDDIFRAVVKGFIDSQISAMQSNASQWEQGVAPSREQESQVCQNSSSFTDNTILQYLLLVFC